MVQCTVRQTKRAVEVPTAPGSLGTITWLASYWMEWGLEQVLSSLAIGGKCWPVGPRRGWLLIEQPGGSQIHSNPIWPILAPFRMIASSMGLMICMLAGGTEPGTSLVYWHICESMRYFMPKMRYMAFKIYIIHSNRFTVLYLYNVYILCLCTLLYLGFEQRASVVKLW